MAIFETELENLSYALGMNMSEYLSHLPIEIDNATFVKAFEDFNNDGKFKFTPEEYQKYMKQFQEEAQKASQAAIAEIAQKNIEREVEFLAENGKKEGVVTTESGLQYEVITAADGAKATKDNVVKVHYTGTLLNG